MKHMEGRSSGSVTLEGPSCKTWQVELIQQNDDLFLYHGWPAFVRDNYVECGDFLIFRYDGELHFTVQVFDQSACEKEAAFHSECSQDICDKNLGQKREREDGISSSDKIVEGVLKKMRESSSEVCSERIHENQQEAMLDLCREKGCHCEGVTVANFSKETQAYGSSPNSYAITSQSGNCNEKPGKWLNVLLGFSDKI